MNWFGRVYHNVKPKTALCFYYILSPLSPNLTSKILFWRKFKRPLNLKAPRTLNEKIMWLKLNTYSRDPLVAQCADKWRVREYVEARMGEEPEPGLWSLGFGLSDSLGYASKFICAQM